MPTRGFWLAAKTFQTRTLVEAAAASSFAATMRLKERLKGRKVALICSGANIAPAQLRELLNRR